MTETTQEYVNFPTLSTNISSNTTLQQNRFARLALLASIEIVIALVIIIGNMLTIMSVIKYHQLRTATNALIVSLSVADLLVGLVVPLQFAATLNPDHLPKDICLMRAVWVIATLSASATHLGLIGADRFIAIVHPLRYKTIVTSKRIMFCILVAWVYAVVLACIHIVWNNIEEGTPCYFLWDTPKEYLIYLVSYCFMMFVLMAILYSKIFAEAEMQRRKIAAADAPHAEAIEANETRKKEMKHVKTLLLVLGVFFACSFPWATIVVVRVTIHDSPFMKAIYELWTLLTFANSGMNPVIYAWKNGEFRKAFKNILQCRHQVNV